MLALRDLLSVTFATAGSSAGAFQIFPQELYRPGSPSVCRFTAKAPDFKASSVTSTVDDDVAPEVSLNPWATLPKVAQVPSWMWARAEMPAVAKIST